MADCPFGIVTVAGRSTLSSPDSDRVKVSATAQLPLRSSLPFTSDLLFSSIPTVGNSINNCLPILTATSLTAVLLAVALALSPASALAITFTCMLALPSSPIVCGRLNVALRDICPPSDSMFSLYTVPSRRALPLSPTSDTCSFHPPVVGIPPSLVMVQATLTVPPGVSRSSWVTIFCTVRSGPSITCRLPMLYEVITLFAPASPSTTSFNAIG